jgi:arylsulfatase A-like enzyme
LGEAKALANDTRFGFTLVHLPIPHAPHAYNRKTGEFTLGNSPIAGYVDSLALLDRTVGEIRRAMENAGTWDSTTVLFTSDHPYRESMQLDGKNDPRIPYILKLASQKEGVEYTPQFNAVLTADLLIAVLKGEIADAASAAAWLDRNRQRSLGR